MKPAKLDFGIESAEIIFQSIINGVTTQVALYSFMNRVGTNKRNTTKALEMLKEHKLQQTRNARAARKIRNILRPNSGELAKGRDIIDIIQPILAAWRLFYAKQGISLMNDQILLLKMIESADELEKLTGQLMPDIVTAD
ncbi:hypothetical protein [Yersinia alsatica]|uniref:hypothetical protein n=1 Tax=Yersinia alsatica TaxID=2890317 RepID=UPI00119E555D|nr:hypothetical protein [Yersinia alsatica]